MNMHGKHIFLSGCLLAFLAQAAIADQLDQRLLMALDSYDQRVRQFLSPAQQAYLKQKFGAYKIASQCGARLTSLNRPNNIVALVHPKTRHMIYLALMNRQGRIRGKTLAKGQANLARGVETRCLSRAQVQKMDKLIKQAKEKARSSIYGGIRPINRRDVVCVGPFDRSRRGPYRHNRKGLYFLCYGYQPAQDRLVLIGGWTRRQ